MTNLLLNETLILDSLRKSPKQPIELSEELGIKPSNLSNYLKTLRLLNLIDYRESEDNRKHRVYFIKAENEMFLPQKRS